MSNSNVDVQVIWHGGVQPGDLVDVMGLGLKVVIEVTGTTLTTRDPTILERFRYWFRRTWWRFTRWVHRLTQRRTGHE